VGVACIWPETVGDSFTVVDGQDVEDLLPAVDSAGEVLAVLPAAGGDEVENFHRGLLGWEMSSVLDGPPEPGVE